MARVTKAAKELAAAYMTLTPEQKRLFDYQQERIDELFKALNATADKLNKARTYIFAQDLRITSMIAPDKKARGFALDHGWIECENGKIVKGDHP